MVFFIRTFLLLGFSLTACSGFVAPSRTNVKVSKTILQVDNTKQPPPLPPVKDISYGEESRKYRRTVYTHDDWVKHRSPQRFLRNLSGIFVSGVYKSLANEVLITTGIATVLVGYNLIVGGYTDFEGTNHAAIISSGYLPVVGLPLAPFTLSSPSLGLLLSKCLSLLNL